MNESDAALLLRDDLFYLVTGTAACTLAGVTWLAYGLRHQARDRVLLYFSCRMAWSKP